MELKLFGVCLQPCITMSLRRKELYTVENRITYGYLQYEILDAITVYKEAAAYDMFSLIVDLGSNLGLWLGLSALSIFDTILQVVTFRCA